MTRVICKVLKMLFLCLLAVAAAGENNTRSSRQLTYSSKPAYQPTVQHYYIGKIQNGPEANQVEQATFMDRYLRPYHTTTSLQDGSAFAEEIAEHNTAYSGNSAYSPGRYSGEVSFRQLGLLAGLFNNRYSNGNANLNTFRPLANRVPLLVVNPDAVTRFGSCDAPNGDKGICVTGPECSIYGGRASGSCSFTSVCCVNVVTRCSATVTLNNTYFQSPAQQLTTPTSCTLTVKLDTRLKEQTQAICQVRLDFLTFNIAQPSQTGLGTVATAQTIATQCTTDSFKVGGALNTVPVICGDNEGQHMYLHVPPSRASPGDVRLTFNLGSGTITRSWNIRIALLPCSSSNLAPADCLQYFSSISGSVSSFNWRDVSPSATRQLANQNYKICFRTEFVNNKKRAESICFSYCTTPNNGDPFLLSGLETSTTSLAGVAGSNNCNDAGDYIAIADVTGSANERFCGNHLNPTTGLNAGAQVCSSGKPFELLYRTDGQETAPSGSTATEKDNVGFCLNFKQD